jgi:hypothetical protein
MDEPMSFKRIFQDNNGTIDALQNIGLTSFKYLYDHESEKENIVVLWFKTDKDTWLRIFIDGTICGIDEYIYDELSSDIKENITCVDYTRWVDNSKIVNAQVALPDLQKIELTLNLSNNNSIVFAIDSSEKGSIKFLTHDF